MWLAGPAAALRSLQEILRSLQGKWPCASSLSHARLPWELRKAGCSKQKKGSRKSRKPKKASSKGECLSAQRMGAVAA